MKNTTQQKQTNSDEEMRPEYNLSEMTVIKMGPKRKRFGRYTHKVINNMPFISEEEDAKAGRTLALLKKLVEEQIDCVSHIDHIILSMSCYLDYDPRMMKEIIEAFLSDIVYAIHEADDIAVYLDKFGTFYKESDEDSEIKFLEADSIYGYGAKGEHEKVLRYIYDDEYEERSKDRTYSFFEKEHQKEIEETERLTELAKVKE